MKVCPQFSTLRTLANPFGNFNSSHLWCNLVAGGGILVPQTGVSSPPLLSVTAQFIRYSSSPLGSTWPRYHCPISCSRKVSRILFQPIHRSQTERGTCPLLDSRSLNVLSGLSSPPFTRETFWLLFKSRIYTYMFPFLQCICCGAPAQPWRSLWTNQFVWHQSPVVPGLVAQ